MKIGYKIESVVGVNFKKLLAKIVNLIFKYILSSYFVECGWRCSKIIENVGVNRALVWIRPSGRARDSDRDTIEKENQIKCK